MVVNLTMKTYVLLAFGAIFVYLLVTLDKVAAQRIAPAVTRTLAGDYCRLRPSGTCCPGRKDECSVPMMGTLCYCDHFCMRGDSSDCCPDFYPVCRRQPPPIPPPLPILRCFYNGKYYDVNKGFTLNCNKCTCQVVNPTKVEMMCEENPCLIRPEIIQRVNQGQFGWQATNYTMFWGKTLEEGYAQLAGVCKPEAPVMHQTSVVNGMHIHLEEDFDARQKWPGYIQPVRDQQQFPASWAISTVDVAADRLAIQSQGQDQMTLSSQALISCIAKRKNHCNTGSTDRAWWFLRTFGTVTEQCYPYKSGGNGEKGRCEIQLDTKAESVRCPIGWRQSILYRTPPPYRISSKETDIMTEIKTNGPVQSLVKVRPDFFSYSSGVYEHTNSGMDANSLSHHHNSHHYLAVRIIGWGVDRRQGRPIKYWLCANSWGRQWGENGYFRIVRGRDESDIEMFVVASWAKRNGNNELTGNLVPNVV